MPPSPSPPIIWCSVEALLLALRAQADSINISRLEIDRHAGFPDGYSAKLLAPRPSKQLSLAGICKLCPALAFDLALVPNAAYLERITALSPQRDVRHTQHAAVIQFSARHFRKIGRLGGLNSRKRMTRRQASALGRKASAARWAKAEGAGP
jgi:hypothetical protein